MEHAVELMATMSAVKLKRNTTSKFKHQDVSFMARTTNRNALRE
jgi:hypothetical protein